MSSVRVTNSRIYDGMWAIYSESRARVSEFRNNEFHNFCNFNDYDLDAPLEVDPSAYAEELGRSNQFFSEDNQDGAEYKFVESKKGWL